MNLVNVSSLAMAVAVATVTLLYCAYVPKKIIVISKPYVSEVARARVATYLTPYNIMRLSCTGLYDEIKKIISSISNVALSHNRPGQIKLYLDAMIPCAVINNERVLTSQGALVSLEDYDLDVLKQLPHIVVVEEFFGERSRKNCSEWIQRVPLDILESFFIVWYARSHIELVPRDTKFSGLLFITSLYTTFSSEMIATMERVAQKNKRVDLRVPHYVIVSPILRGSL